MEVVTSLSRAARQCSVLPPSSWITATTLEHVEIRDDFLADTVADILDRVDLPAPIGATTTITGTGAETYDLPANFLRVHRDRLAVYDELYDDGAIPVTTESQWTELREERTSGAQRYYRISGYEGAWDISFLSEPSSDVIVHYNTRNWLSASGTPGYTLANDTDVLLLPNRLVEAGIVWRFRERKGLPFADKYAEYEALMSRLSNDTQGRRVINLGRKKVMRWQDRVPAEIPSS